MNGTRTLGVISAIALIGLGVLPRLLAQTQSPTSASPTFEVASIKPYPSGAPHPGIGILTIPASGGRLRAANVTVIPLIAEAFRTSDGALRNDQIVGGPDWIRSSAFDVVATASAGMSRETFVAQIPAMLRSLLEDRFNLSTHVETRMRPVYTLVKARSDGRLGPHIHSVDVDCDAIERERLADAARLNLSPAERLAASRSTNRPVCGTRGLPDGFIAGAITMRDLAAGVRVGVDRPVLDRTGPTGRFDVELHWTSTQAPLPNDTPAGTAAPLSDGPSVFTALQEQVGLKLESRQEPVDVLVIDHIERPAED